jgi:hypothetical protein
MKIMKIIMIMAMATLFLFTGCRPYNKPDLVTVLPNETAFVIPLTGESLNGQARFDSVEFLEERKVASKRIEVPRVWFQEGRAWFDGKYIDTARVIKVSRTPITAQWIPKVDNTSNKLLGGVQVESLDSIGFGLGVVCTAQVEEPDTATYLYYYPEKSLKEVIATNIFADIQTELSREFAERNLQVAKAEKNQAFDAVKEDIISFYKVRGITISSLGLSGGLWFEDEEIQDSINAAYVSEMAILEREQAAKAQKFENDRLLSIAANQREQAEEFAKAAEARKAQVSAEVQLIYAESFKNAVNKWDGKSMPRFIGGNMPNFIVDDTK